MLHICAGIAAVAWRPVGGDRQKGTAQRAGLRSCGIKSFQSPAWSRDAIPRCGWSGNGSLTAQVLANSRAITERYPGRSREPQSLFGSLVERVMVGMARRSVGREVRETPVARTFCSLGTEALIPA